MQDIPEVLKPSMDPDMLSVTIREAAELNTQNEWDAAIEMSVPYEWATRAAYLEEALAHRDRALEWLGATFAEYDDLACPERCCEECPRLTGDEELESPPCHEELTEDMPRKCWILAALAATEEE